MKKLMIAMCLASSMLCSSAATYEENLATANTPISEITEANVASVVDACVAVTNLNKISSIRDKGFLTFEQVAEKVTGVAGMEWLVYYNALYSSNSVLRASAVDAFTKAAIADSRPCAQNVSRQLTLAILNYKNKDGSLNITPAKRMEIVRTMLDAGRIVQAIPIAYGSIPVSVFKPGATVKGWETYTPEYQTFLAEISIECYNYWLADSLSHPNIWVDGADIIKYYEYIDPSKLTDDVVKRLTPYIKDYGNWHFISRKSNSPFHDAIVKIVCESEKFVDSKKILAASYRDTANRNKAMTEFLYPYLKDDDCRVKIALYLNDIDKLIDSLMVISDKLDAETINSVIAPLNGVNAGYRTNDLRLALMNINKKYTLKLYDDRDTWEPILSKIRAMIDAL